MKSVLTIVFYGTLITLVSLMAATVVTAQNAWNCPLDGKRVHTGQDYARCNRCPHAVCFRHQGQKCQSCRFGRYQRVDQTVPFDEPAVFTSLDAAIQRHIDSNRPLVVVMGADWCSWCRKQKLDLEAVEGLPFEWIYEPHGNCERFKVKGKGIPQLVMFRNRRWVTYVGYRNVKTILKTLKNQKGGNKI